MDEIERVRQIAYEQWENEGRPEGRAEEHWHVALRIMAQRPSVDAPPARLRANKLSDVLSEENVWILEKDLLPRYLSERRWYSAKDRAMGEVRLTASPPSIDDAGLLTQVRVGLDGKQEVYSLPLAIIWDDASEGELTDLAREMSLAEVKGESRTGVLTDAFFVPAFVRALVRNIGAAHSMSVGDDGALHFLKEDAFRSEEHDDQKPRWLSAEQSNSSVIIGGHTVLKLMRRLEDGVHPEPEMCRFLTRAGFQNSSPLYAEVIHSDGAERRRTLAVAQGFVANDGDAWTYAVKKFCDGVSLRPSDADRVAEASASDAAAFESVEAMSAAVGMRLGEPHSVLSTGRGDPAFEPEPANDQDIKVWKEAAVTQLIKAFDVISQSKALPLGPSGDESLLQLFISERDKIVQAVENSTLASNGSSKKIRIHGDFHLGQVLLSGEDVFIIDFEGEPARPADERRAKSHPFRDVAGLLRSIAYAAAFSMQEHDDSTASDRKTLAARVQASRLDAENAFLQSYASAAPGGVGLEGRSLDLGLLELFLVEKAAYEVCYEAANRPKWLTIPLRGLIEALMRFPELEKLGDDANWH